ncbi:unnamed protein product, partial [Owenia fusiformis]
GLGGNELQFQDIAHSASDQITNAENEQKEKEQTHTFKNFPTSGADDDGSDYEGDKAELLTGEKKQPSFWAFEYYQGFFDVDTYQVLGRIGGSMLPHPKRNFLRSKIRPNPDLYGPFWICATLTFTTAIAGNLAGYIQTASAGNDYKWTYDFHKVTFAATAIFAYWWVIPTLLWALLRWRGSQAGYTFLEIICVYGYSLAIYIPISILWVIQVNWLQWLLVVLGMVLSGSVLIFTFWPAVREDDKKVAYSTMGFILLFHGLLAVGFVLYFFHVPAVAPVVGPTAPLVPEHIKKLNDTPTQHSEVPQSANRVNNIVNIPNKMNDMVAKKPETTNQVNIQNVDAQEVTGQKAQQQTIPAKSGSAVSQDNINKGTTNEKLKTDKNKPLPKKERSLKKEAGSSIVKKSNIESLKT